MVLVDSDGTLLAAGNGTPPNWVVDSGGAEVWAFLQVLSSYPECVRITTDYFNIVTMLQAGRHSATAANRPLARAWAHIYDIIMKCKSIDILLKRVCWMPAHCTVSAIGTRVKSNGEFVTALDWRANRLVDYLARLAANLVTVPKLASIILDQFSKAAVYSAASLGVITHAANNHTISVTREDGKIINRKVRDNNADQARERARGTKRGQETLEGLQSHVKRAKVEDQTEAKRDKLSRKRSPDCIRMPAQKHHVATAKAEAVAKAKAIEVEREQSFRDHWRDRLDSSKITLPVVTGAEKLAALKARIRGRSVA